MQARILRGKEDAEIEHLSGFKIELWMGGERAGLIQASAEGELSACLQCMRIKFPWEALFSEGQQPAGEGIDAHIYRRLQAVLCPVEPAARKRSAESTEQGM